MTDEEEKIVSHFHNGLSTYICTLYEILLDILPSQNLNACLALSHLIVNENHPNSAGTSCVPPSSQAKPHLQSIQIFYSYP